VKKENVVTAWGLAARQAEYYAKLFLSVVGSGICLLFAGTAQAQTTILGSVSNSSLSNGGFWVGSWDLSMEGPNSGAGPDGFVHTTVAQLFQSFADYSQVTAAMYIQPGYISGPTPSVSFYLAPDNNGTPGTAIASTNVVLDTGNYLGAFYQIPFENMSLVDGQNYWLVASSDSVFSDFPIKGGSLPNLRLSNGWNGPMAWSQNSSPWQFQNASFAFALYGTETGNPLDNGNTQPSVQIQQSIPEPETYAMMLAGLGLLGFMRRRRKQKIA
jgi:hypothetical protein